MMSADHPKTMLDGRERWIGRLSATIFLVIVGLFALIRIEGAVVATGLAVVEGKPRPVQSVDGGMVSDIAVRDGDVVAAGDLLLRLDSSLLEVNRDILKSRLAELTARRARLEAEERGDDHVRPAAVDASIEATTFLSYLKGQTRIFEARRDVLRGQRAQLAQRVAQYERRTEGLKAQVEASRAKMELLDHEIANLGSLNERGLTPESRLLELQGRRAAEAAQLVTLNSDIAANFNAIRDAQLQITQTESTFRESVTTELREVVLSYEETRLEILRIDQELKRLEIRAPVAGVVHEMQVAAAGGVLAPQEVILTVIPAGGGVEFSLEIAPDAVDAVYLGQEARLRFPAFDAKSTPEIFGAIVRVSPDSVVDPATGRAFFRVEVRVGQDELARLGGQELVPGMPVEALLKTERRSILSYFVKPLTDQMVHAFREG